MMVTITEYVMRMTSEFISPTRIVYGTDSFSKLKEHLPEGDIILVLGRSSARALDLEKRVKEQLKGDISVFSGIEPNPLSTTIERGAEFLREHGKREILAAGGGSVMDAAKYMSVLADHGGRVLDYASGKRTPKEGGRRIYAVPTTPGTSSEITPFSVATVPEMNNKVGLRHSCLFPETAIIDPALTVSLPKEQTASTGLDILSHAVESFWAKKATPLTRDLSLRSVELIASHLRGAYNDGKSIIHREGVSLASVFAGLAFSNTGTTICHAISYPLTVDTGVPHGMACAMSIGPTFDIMSRNGLKGAGQLASAFGSTVDAFPDDLRSFLRSLDAPVDLSEIDYKGGRKRITDTDLSVLQVNSAIELSDDEVLEIIDSMED